MSLSMVVDQLLELGVVFSDIIENSGVIQFILD